MATATGTVPARAVLSAVEAEAAEHLGALSATRGLLPLGAPASTLPASHSAWDEAARQLPELWRDLTARRVLADLPLLDACPAALPNDALWRASVVMSCIAFTYVRCDVEHLHVAAPVPLPASIERPWRALAARMGRPAAHVSHDDLVTHNWRLLDAGSPDPVRLENVVLGVPITGNETERASLAVQVEILAELAPCVEAMVRAQEAVTAEDRDALLCALRLIKERLRHIADVSLAKLSANRGAPLVADPVVWAKLVAPTGIAITADAPGFGGTQSSPVQLLDAFLARTRFDTHVGAEALRLRPWQAPNVRRFTEALAQISVAEYVEHRRDRELAGAWRTLVGAFAGEHGYLGAHARKAYGYIQTAFKVGRPSTSAGIGGTFADRGWRETYQHLQLARQERFRGAARPHVAHLVRRIPATERTVQLVTLDIAGTGLRLRPGDRCAVYPDHAPALVDRTLAAARPARSESA